MSQVTPGNGWLLDPASAPDFTPSPLVLYGQLAPRSPDYLFRGDSLNALRPVAPQLTLVANGGALVNQAFPGPGLEGEPNVSPLMVKGFQYTNTNATYHAISDTSILDIDGSQSVSFSLCFRTTTDEFPVASGAIFGKRQTGDLVGYELILNTGGTLNLSYKDAVNPQVDLGFSLYNNGAGQHRYADGRWHVVHIEFDKDAQEVRMGTEHPVQMVGAWPASSLSTTTEFRLGGVRAFAAGPFQLAWLAASLGPTAMSNDPSGVALALAEECALVTRLEHRGEVNT